VRKVQTVAEKAACRGILRYGLRRIRPDRCHAAVQQVVRNALVNSNPTSSRMVRAVEIFLLGSQERHTPRTLPGAARGDSWINNQSQRNGVSRMTVQSLWEHYCREELPFKDFSTQDGYLSYAKNWILPRWGRVLLLRLKTVEVERWLRDATVSNGTRVKIKCVVSALFSHAVRWELASTNPISSGTPVGSGGKRVPASAFE
jgi:hypothetical protein